MISTDLIDAYRQTHYVVSTGQDECVIRIGHGSAALVALLDHYQVGEAAFISACNPASKVLRPDDNQARHADLTATAERLGYACLPGEGRDPQGVWEAEPSLLILGITKPAADALAMRYGQYAYVWLRRGLSAELVLMQD